MEKVAFFFLGVLFFTMCGTDTIKDFYKLVFFFFKFFSNEPESILFSLKIADLNLIFMESEKQECQSVVKKNIQLNGEGGFKSNDVTLMKPSPSGLYFTG